jgi:hypothetical protein
MNRTTRLPLLASASLLLLAGVSMPVHAQQMSFFVTSAGIGKGADLGGLAGADGHCQQLAQAAGAGSRTWHAYLSTQAAGRKAAVNARDRIGRGPWQNAKGLVVANNVDELHGTNNLTKETALSAEREGRGGQRLRRQTQPSRRADWLHPGRPQLDQQHARLDDARPYRSAGTARR